MKSPMTIGPYRLIDAIGEGGGGVVYLAEQSEPVERQVAVKILRSGGRRFALECEALAMLQHPSIASLHDAGTTEDGQPYLVMEYVEGQPLHEYCDAEGLSVEERIRLFIDVCRAVKHAHQKTIVHRDLKPANVLVTRIDGRPAVKVIDFGIAKAIGRDSGATELTRAGELVGTPDYMSPEQAGLVGDGVDTRSDIYSLGVMLYELFAGETPFDSKTLLARGIADFHRVLSQEAPPRPSTRVATGELDRTPLARELEGDLDWITLRALEKEPDDRYQSVDDLVADLGRYLCHEPVRAGPPTLEYHVRKFLRRNRTKIAAAAFVLVALIAGLGVAIWHWRVALDREIIATEALAKEKEALRWVEGDRLAGEASIVMHEDPALAILLAMEAARTSASYQKVTTLYRAIEKHHERRVLWGHEARVRDFAVSPDDLQALTVDDSELLILWHLGDSRLIRRMDPHDTRVTELAFSADGRFCSSGSLDGRLVVYDATDGRELCRFEVGRPVFAGTLGDTIGMPIAWPRRVSSADGRLALVTEGSRAFVVDAASGARRGALVGHRGAINKAAFIKNDTAILTVSDDRSVRVWIVNPLYGSSFLAGQHCLRVCRDGRHAFVRDDDGRAVLYELPEGKALWRSEASGARGALFSDKTERAVITCARRALLFDVKQAEVVRELTIEEGAVVRLSPDGTRLLVEAPSGRHALVDWDSDRQLARLERPKLGGFVFSADNARLLARGGGQPNLVWLLDGPTLATIRVFGDHSGATTDAQFSPDGRWILTAAADTSTNVYDAKTLEQRMVVPNQPAGDVFIRCHPDGNLFVCWTGGWIGLYELSNVGRLTDWKDGPYRHVQFTADGNWLCIVKASGDLRFVPIDARRYAEQCASRPFTAEERARYAIEAVATDDPWLTTRDGARRALELLRAGDTVRARGVLDRVRAVRRHLPGDYWFARACTIARDPMVRDRTVLALTALETAVRAGLDGLAAVHVIESTPCLAALRTEPRYRDLLRRLER